MELNEIEQHWKNWAKEFKLDVRATTNTRGKTGQMQGRCSVCTRNSKLRAAVLGQLPFELNNSGALW